MNKHYRVNLISIATIFLILLFQNITLGINCDEPTRYPTAGSACRYCSCEGGDFIVYGQIFTENGKDCTEPRIPNCPSEDLIKNPPDYSKCSYNQVIAYYNNGNTSYTANQCVEYVKRYYATKKLDKECVERGGGSGSQNCDSDIDCDSPDTCEAVGTCTWFGHAGTFFDQGPSWGLNKFLNGGETPPAEGDILCYKDGGYGHVAIVMNVTGFGDEQGQGKYKVKIIQQNVNPAIKTLDMVRIDNKFYLPNTLKKYGNYSIPGWLRAPSTSHQSYPYPEVTYHPNGTLIRGRIYYI